MASSVRTNRERNGGAGQHPDDLKEPQEIIEAESVLLDLAGTYFDATGSAGRGDYRGEDEREPADARTPNLEAKYRALLEQMPAVVFMADRKSVV